MYGTGYDPRVYALVAFPARYALEMHNWAEAASLTPVPEARSGDGSITYWARRLAPPAVEMSRRHALISTHDGIHKTLVDQKKKGFAEAVEQDRKEAAAWLDHAQGKNDDAIAALRAIAERQESSGTNLMAEYLPERCSRICCSR